MSKLKRTIEIVRRDGIAALGECLFCKMYYRLLQRIFRFDSWHATAPYACRSYKKQTVKLASSLSPSVAVEIGCGLGEIISRLNAKQLYGFDVDVRAVAAARWLFGSKVRFEPGSLFEPRSVAGAVDGKEVDVIMMVNWLHGMKFDAVERSIGALVQYVHPQHLIVDTIKPGMMPDAIFHSVSDFERLGNIERTVAGEDGVRDLHLIRLYHDVDNRSLKGLAR
jgi:hypothetical protein